MSVESPFSMETIDELVEITETRDPRRGLNVSFQYVDIASVCNQRFQINAPKNIAAGEAPSRARKVIYEKDVVFATTRPYLKSIAMVPQDLNDQICSTGFCVLRSGTRILPEWLFYCVTSDEFVRQITPLMRGANYPAVTDKDVRAARIPVPSLDEQRRILIQIKECLSRIDEIEKLRVEQLDETAKLPDALLDALIDEAWDSISLGDLASDVRNGWSGKEKQDADPVRVLKLSCVHNRHIDVSESKAVRVSPETTTDFLIKRHDVFVVRGNGSAHLVGRSAISDQDEEGVIFNDLLIRLRFRENVLPAFANVVLHSRMVRAQILATAKTAAGIWKINQKHLASLKIPVPPLADQKKLVEVASTALSEARSLKSNLQQCESRNLRESILRKAFAGEL